tara:strand:+ start:309 stop:500 length:192 start_codon:yes stop_codon:yes gene_type:complete
MNAKILGILKSMLFLKERYEKTIAPTVKKMPREYCSNTKPISVLNELELAPPKKMAQSGKPDI